MSNPKLCSNCYKYETEGYNIHCSVCNMIDEFQEELREIECMSYCLGGSVKMGWSEVEEKIREIAKAIHAQEKGPTDGNGIIVDEDRQKPIN